MGATGQERLKTGSAAMLPHLARSSHKFMQRLIMSIAILFAFAALAGVTTAHAHRYVATPIVVLNHVDAENVPIRIMVKVQRGEIDLGEGIVMPYGGHHAIAAEAPELPFAPEGDMPRAFPTAPIAHWPADDLLRPPISA